MCTLTALKVKGESVIFDDVPDDDARTSLRAGNDGIAWSPSA